MARTVWGNPERYRDSYWARFADQGYFFSGDGAKYDADGDIWLLGRVDDVINVSGHRLSTIEIESALVAHPAVGEAGVVGVTDAIDRARRSRRSSSPPTCRSSGSTTRRTGPLDASCAALRGTSRAIGPIAKPRDIVLVPDLPKTRSGKIMRRLLGDIARRAARSATRHRCRTRRCPDGSRTSWPRPVAEGTAGRVAIERSENGVETRAQLGRGVRGSAR